MNVMNKRFCITGGFGFIGSHFVDLLFKNNHEVSIVDNFSSNVVSGFPQGCKEVFSESIVDLDFRRLPEFDVLVHFASIVGPVGVLSSAGNIAYSIINDTRKLADYCIKKNILFVYISTSEVYGHGGILSENSWKKSEGRYSPRMEYGMGKLAAEIMIYNLSKTCSLDYRIIRPFNVSGSRQKPHGGFVLPRFVIAALTNQPLTVYGDGIQTRSIAHVRDVCEAIYYILKKGETRGIWNVGNSDNTLSIIDLADIVIRMAGKGTVDFVDPKMIHGNLFEEVGDKIACIDKIKNIGWSPKYSIEQIVSDVIGYYQPLIEKGYSFNVK